MTGRIPIPAWLSASPALLLFLPGDRLDRLHKARTSGATAVVVDWEDALAQPSRTEARSVLRSALRDTDGAPVIVRLNAIDTDDHARDADAIADIPEVAALMLAKAEDPVAIGALSERLNQRPVVALIETPRGLANARGIAAASARLAFGSLDYAVALRARHTREALSLARQELVLASALAGLAGPIDGVTLSLDDRAITTDDARYAAGLGFAGKLIVHPRQLSPATDGFAPSAEDLVRARRIVVQAGTTRDGGAASVDGGMVDPPVLAWAEDVIARADVR